MDALGAKAVDRHNRAKAPVDTTGTKLTRYSIQNWRTATGRNNRSNSSRQTQQEQQNQVDTTGAKAVAKYNSSKT